MQSSYSRYVPIKAMEPVEKFCLKLGVLALVVRQSQSCGSIGCVQCGRGM